MPPRQLAVLVIGMIFFTAFDTGGHLVTRANAQTWSHDRRPLNSNFVPGGSPVDRRSRTLRNAASSEIDETVLNSLASRLGQEAIALFHDARYKETLATLDQRASITPEDQGLSLIRGWTLYHLGELDKALMLFTELDRRESTRDTQYGVYYSRRRLDPTHIGD